MSHFENLDVSCFPYSGKKMTYFTVGEMIFLLVKLYFIVPAAVSYILYAVVSI